MLSVIGVSVFCLAFFGMLWAQSRRWRYLARAYGRTEPRPISQRNMQSAVLVNWGGFNSHKGIVTIGVHPTGMSLRLMAPFSLFHTPLFVPFEDIHSQPTRWYLDSEACELEFRQAPDVKVVMPAKQWEWIHRTAGHKVTRSSTRNKRASLTAGWHIFSLVNAGLAAAFIVVFSWYWLIAPVL